jgi:hypothetical protein
VSVVSLIPTPGSRSQASPRSGDIWSKPPQRKGITSRRRRIRLAASTLLGPAASRTREPARIDRRRSIMFCASSPEIALSRGNAQRPFRRQHVTGRSTYEGKSCRARNRAFRLPLSAECRHELTQPAESRGGPGRLAGGRPVRRQAAARAGQQAATGAPAHQSRPDEFAYAHPRFPTQPREPCIRREARSELDPRRLVSSSRHLVPRDRVGDEARLTAHAAGVSSNVGFPEWSC